jgi:hypothetical protein
MDTAAAAANIRYNGSQAQHSNLPEGRRSRRGWDGRRDRLPFSSGVTPVVTAIEVKSTAALVNDMAMIAGEAPTLHHYKTPLDDHLDAVAGSTAVRQSPHDCQLRRQHQSAMGHRSGSLHRMARATLVHMFQQLAAVEAGAIAPPTIEELIGGITPIDWPS